jgi:hypothetical protein
LVVSNLGCDAQLPPDVDWVMAEDDLDVDHAVYRADLLDIDHPWRHDSEKLAHVLIDLYYDRTGPLVE